MGSLSSTLDHCTQFLQITGSRPQILSLSCFNAWVAPHSPWSKTQPCCKIQQLLFYFFAILHVRPQFFHHIPPTPTSLPALPWMPQTCSHLRTFTYAVPHYLLFSPSGLDSKVTPPLSVLAFSVLFSLFYFLCSSSHYWRLSLFTAHLLLKHQLVVGRGSRGHRWKLGTVSFAAEFLSPNIVAAT